MKYSTRVFMIVMIVGAGIVTTFAQQNLSMTYGQFTVSFQTTAQKGSVLLPLLDGQSATGAKERLGILFKTDQAKKVFVEILDNAGKVIKGISVNDFLGKSSNSSVKIISNTISGSGRIMETIHEVKLPSGTTQLITRALLAGDKNNPASPEQIILTFSLKSSVSANLSLRLSLPVDGSAEIKEGGIVLSGKSIPSAIAIAVLPKETKTEVKKNIVTLSSSTISVSDATPLLWLIITGANAASVSGAKSAAETRLSSDSKAFLDPNVVVINSVSKINAQPGDTVMYSVICKNVGIGDATNIVLSSPIPPGTMYVEGSATETQVDLSFEKEKVNAPQVPAVKTIQWKLKDALKSGEERSVSFKVVLQ